MYLLAYEQGLNIRALTLLEKLGAESVDLIIEQFYKHVLSDDLLKPFFKQVSMQKLLEHQQAFFYMALGGPDMYQGRSMAEAHKGLNLQEEHFNAIARYLVQALKDYAFEDDVIEEIIETIAPLKPEILGK